MPHVFLERHHHHQSPAEIKYTILDIDNFINTKKNQVQNFSYLPKITKIHQQIISFESLQSNIRFSLIVFKSSSD